MPSRSPAPPFSLVPAIRIGHFIGRHFAMRFWLKEKNFRRNHAIAFPGRDADADIRAAAAQFVSVAATIPYLRAIAARRALRLEGARSIPAGPVIFLGAHVGNWELGPVALSLAGRPVLNVYSGLRPRWLDRLVLRMRALPGMDFVEKRHAPRAAIAHLAGGGSLGLVIDQRTTGGHDVIFFGHSARFTHLPARLALRFGVPLVMLEDVSDADGLAVRFHPPIMPAGLAETEITQRIATMVESIICRNPGRWFCNKRRWPREVYR